MTEVPREQIVQLSILENEMRKLKYLSKISVQMASGFEKQSKLHEELKLQHQTLLGQSVRFIEQLEQHLWEEYECLETYSEEDGCTFKRKKNAPEQLKHHSYLLGYAPSLDYAMEEVTLYYKEEYFIKLKIDEPYDLLQIHPKHPFFEGIKLNLYKSNDIAGLLATLRKFFDLS